MDGHAFNMPHQICKIADDSNEINKKDVEEKKKMSFVFVSTKALRNDTVDIEMPMAR